MPSFLYIDAAGARNSSCSALHREGSLRWRNCSRTALAVSSDHADSADTFDDHVLAGVRLRADEPVHRPGRHPARPRPHHRVRRRELVGGKARPARIHRGTRRSRRTGAGHRRGGRRRVLDRLHRRDRAGVPQADHRTTGVVHPAHLSGAHRRGQVLRAPAARDRRQAPTRRHRRGQRRAVPGAGDCGRAVRADRVVQPAGGDRPERAAAVLRPAERRPQPMGRLPRRVRPHPPRDVGRLRRLGAGPGCRRLTAIWSSCPAPTQPTSTSIRPRPTTSTPARSTTAGPGWTPACARPTRSTSCPPRSPTGPKTARSSTCRLVHSAGADVELMQRLVDVLGTTRHRFIVSKGPQADRITLADNMVGAQMLPQTKVIPQVDLVISHGGNNTVTETLHFGKPLIVLPLFWDQYENAQRIDELGFGVAAGHLRASPTPNSPTPLTGCSPIPALRTRLAEIGHRDPRPRRPAGRRRRHRAGGCATPVFG